MMMPAEAPREFLKWRNEMQGFRGTIAGILVFTATVIGLGSVKSDYESNFDFDRLRTFAFKTERSSKDPLTQNTIEAERIQKALAAQLQANGFTQSTQNPDFIVAFYSRKKQETELQSTGFGIGPGWGWGYGIPGRGRWRWGFGPDIWTDNYIEGCIMVDMIAPRTNELVWRGVATDMLSGIDQSEKQVNNAAKDLIKKFVKDGKKAEK
jgi:Domain of unknown function (DUF4136)